MPHLEAKPQAPPGPSHASGGSLGRASGISSVCRRFGYTACVLFALVLGVCLRWSTLYAGFASDDFIEPAMLDGVYPSPRGPLDLFDFVRGTPDDNRTLMHYGALPWWTVSGLRLAMLRPLASVLIIVDRKLFGSDPFPYHVHSMLWWVALMLVAAALFRRLFPRPVASIAIVLFALEEGHTLPLSWLANRAAIVAMALGVLGLLCHLRWREDGKRASAWLELLCFAVAMSTGEWAFPLLGYVLAYELLYQRGPLWPRALALLPCGIPGFLFLLTRSLLGYGALNSGVYIDPVTEPWTFFVAACQRIPIFFGDLFFSVPANWWAFGCPWRDWLLSFDLVPPRLWVQLPGWHFWQVAIGVVAMIGSVLTLRWGLRDRAKGELRQIRWMLAGAFISLIPMVASYPTSRLVLPASLAASAACASVLLSGAARVRERWSRARGSAVVALLVSCLVAYFQIWQAGRTSNAEAHLASSGFRSIREQVLRAPIDDRTVGQQRVVLINSVEHTSTIFWPFVRHFYGHPLPAAAWVLSGAPHAHDLYRPSPNVLELSVLGGTLLTTELEQLYRAERFRFQVGEVVDVGGMRAQITRLIYGLPQSVRFIFDKSVDDPSYLFMLATPEGFMRVRLPEVGGRMRYRKGAYPNYQMQDAYRNGRDPNVSCQGPRPPLDECRMGFAFADCGGTGEPVFACHGLGDCRWFLHGCVPVDYATSSCRPDALCCEAGWPFRQHEFLMSEPYTHVISGDLFTWGTTAWDSLAQLQLPVVVDPKLPQAAPQVTCAGGDDAHGPCGAPLPSVEVGPYQESSLRLVFSPAPVREGWALTVEIIDDAKAQLRARVCRVPLPDHGRDEQVAAQCPPPTRPICAQTGRVWLNRFPADGARMSRLAARLQVRFADGLLVDAEL